MTNKEFRRTYEKIGDLEHEVIKIKQKLGKRCEMCGSKYRVELYNDVMLCVSCRKSFSNRERFHKE